MKSTSVVPGISDHDIVVVDLDTKPHYNPQKPKKCFLFGKADWDALRDKCDTMYTEIKRMYTSGSTVENLWSVFKTTLPNEVETHMPSKMFKSRNSPPWLIPNPSHLFSHVNHTCFNPEIFTCDHARILSCKLG